jgi:hypothetical protein
VEFIGLASERLICRILRNWNLSIFNQNCEKIWIM